MRRPVVIGGNPYIADVYRKDARSLFDDTGGNTGNLAFQYAIASHLRGSVSFLPWNAEPAQVRTAGDVVVLPLANQLGRHTDLGGVAARLEAFALPVIGVGLGAQADTRTADVELTPGTARWLKTLTRLSAGGAANIGVRGQYTKTQIERLGYVGCATVTGCPSNFINTSDVADVLRQRFKRTPRHIAVTAGIPFIPKLSRIERDLADIVTTTGGAYIVQHGLEMLRLARREFDLIEPGTLETCRSYIAPHLTLDEFKAWCARHALAFYDARAWMDYVRRFDFVVGTRFHGAMLAMQAGVPAGCITHDSRTQEMCETMAIPHCHYSQIHGGLTRHNVTDYFEFDHVKYKATRAELATRYVGMFADFDVALNPALEGLART